MRLLISYGGVMKIFQNVRNYDEMIKFIRANFERLPEKFTVQYKDAEDDMVSLCAQSDIDNMLETVSSQYVKAYIE